ncbi:AGAP009891-PA-like protein [Anopheles sinensis]|uniref:AGAP009891-PA-like protein n=1 Tax=Anopheles sinensis TaxID=74873 RepID=A0A084W8K3_ANOSI|nr:AGAP009891-PA-like protein [Anopheles sinensis]
MFLVKNTVKIKQFSRCLGSVARFPVGQVAEKSVSASSALCGQRFLGAPLWSPAASVAGNAIVARCGQNKVQLRGISTDEHQSSHPPKRKLPMLMDFPQLVWPSVIKTIRNWIMVHFIIRPYFDREFSLPDFVQGAKQALQACSDTTPRIGLRNNIMSIITDRIVFLGRR